MAIVRCAKCGAKNRVDERGHARRPVCGRCGATLDIHAADKTADNSTAAEWKPQTVTDGNFRREVLGAGAVPVLLDCWAPWCGPCRMLAPTIDALAGESSGRYRVGKLNTDENPGVAGQFQISSIPTLLIFRDGKLINRLVGLQPKNVIAAALKAAM